jgi:DNA-binding XRE family transcriptional regulator
MARKTTRWEDLKHKASPERREQIRREVEAEILDYNLAQIRALVGMTQADAARVIGITQAQISMTERRDDHKLSTLRRYVEGLGGQLEVVASFGTKRFRLHGV